MANLPVGPVGTPMLPTSQHCLVIEPFMDLCCPFSAKMFNVLYNQVLPEYTATGQVQLIFQNVPQPWHPQSTLMHEVVLAVKIVNLDFFYPACNALFKEQALFFDSATFDKTRQELYAAMVDVVVKAVPELDSESILECLALTGAGNSGNAVTNSLKWAVKYHRVRSVHVTPTVFLNGIEAPDISSGWTAEQWKSKIDECLESFQSRM
eukprot:CAMPEP_0185744014 /NCGR_PEP_ID=MMETSP1174-20130828/1972_1 /TAXON_ID=35687 /ORGANISM="Dictyocha speculum, Strain CCMP1381" /LENGTH=207 /DNA_ID=CAMNT_0028417111 /DNA_START=27 /DNA_END=650 /DNA_ORIENTATION=+